MMRDFPYDRHRSRIPDLAFASIAYASFQEPVPSLSCKRFVNVQHSASRLLTALQAASSTLDESHSLAHCKHRRGTPPRNLPEHRLEPATSEGHSWLCGSSTRPSILLRRVQRSKISLNTLSFKIIYPLGVFSSAIQHTIFTVHPDCR